MPIVGVVLLLFTFLIGASLIIYRSNQIRNVMLISTLLIFVAVLLNNNYHFIKPISMTVETAYIVNKGCWIGIIALIVFVVKFIIKQNDYFYTEKEKANEEKEKAVAEVAAANLNKSRYLDETSHELRTPLNTIVSLSDTLKEKLSECKADQQLLEEINVLSSAARLSYQIVNNTLDFSKQEIGKDIRSEKIEFNFSDFLREIASIYHLNAICFHKNIQIVKENIPPFIIEDKLSLTKIINNLITNAIKYSSGTNIELVVQAEKETICFAVINEGEIPQQEIDTIFLPFNTNKKSVESTGIGLTITKKLIELLEGEITVTSAEGKTTFRFRIPLRIGSTNMLYQQEHKDYNFEHCNILVMDDDPMNLMALTSALKLKNGAVQTATNGKDGLKMILEGHFDLVIADQHMPFMGGDEVLARIRNMEQYRTLPFLMITGNNDPGIHQHLMSIGASGSLVKPVANQQLYQVLGQYLPQQWTVA
ncbi:response regulator [Chitinophaga sp. 30R24]|uniref:hybrid sensor histidine kinase/response regulator n=1 Tax=Chitinophaga sp. 30R24 TaxID=3248838 RepID=UPI003B8F3F31